MIMFCGTHLREGAKWQPGAGEAWCCASEEATGRVPPKLQRRGKEAPRSPNNSRWNKPASAAPGRQALAEA